MPSKRHLALATVLGSASTIIAFGIAGAVTVPTHFNIAVALVITLGLLVEAPLTAMAIAKHEPHHH